MHAVLTMDSSAQSPDHGIVVELPTNPLSCEGSTVAIGDAPSGVALGSHQCYGFSIRAPRPDEAAGDKLVPVSQLEVKPRCRQTCIVMSAEGIT